ncbi:hypothetical protein D3C72_1541930 [compost metagenome]
MNPCPSRYRRRKAQAIRAIVDLRTETGDLKPQRQFHPRLQHLDQRPVGDSAAKRTVLPGLLRIGMNPVIVAGQLGKGIDQRLIHQHRVAPVAELLADQRLQALGIINGNLQCRRRHGRWRTIL